MARIEATSKQIGLNRCYEIILIDDACPEGSGDVAEQFVERYENAKVLRLPMNQGQDAALQAGILEARGKWIAILDADLQDPPEALARLWQLRHGHAAVFADRRGRYTSRSRHVTSWIYRRLLQRLTRLPPGAGLYALLDERAAEAVRCSKDNPLVLMAVLAVLDGPMRSVPVQRSTRAQGQSSYTGRMRLAKGIRTLGRSVLINPRSSPSMPSSEPILNKDHQIAEESILAVQRRYFQTRRPVRMLVDSTAYIERHFEEITKAAALKRGERVCEWGAGLGRFSRLLADLDVSLDAIELSPTQASECRNILEPWPQANVFEGDVAEVMRQRGEKYDLIVGFFMLHHLRAVENYLAEAADHLQPGGRIAFVEPNPWNPLYPIQITMTPGMRWEAERGIYELWPNRIISCLNKLGFHTVSVTRYGSLPRAAYNSLERIGMERFPERFIPNLLKPFQLVVAERQR
jgi:glycosyltransferase involved in cell wall biosynthesis